MANFDEDVVDLAEVDFVTVGVATSTGPWDGPALLGPATGTTSMGVVTPGKASEIRLLNHLYRQGNCSETETKNCQMKPQYRKRQSGLQKQ